MNESSHTVTVPYNRVCVRARATPPGTRYVSVTITRSPIFHVRFPLTDRGRGFRAGYVRADLALPVVMDPRGESVSAGSHLRDRRTRRKRTERGVSNRNDNVCR